MRGATLPGQDCAPCDHISIHAPHARSDDRAVPGCRSRRHFNPRSSCEERRRSEWAEGSYPRDFNPRSSCEERPMHRMSILWPIAFQSTLLMRGATAFRRVIRPAMPISIHAPHARSDNGGGARVTRAATFQSTLLMRGATLPLLLRLRASDFNPRSSCEERRRAYTPSSLCAWYFNPRSSCEERPDPPEPADGVLVISIHAPHARSDSVRSCSCSASEFQSTLLMRGATVATQMPPARPLYFNPRSSCEERRGRYVSHDAADAISIHAPHARSDRKVRPTDAIHRHFNPRSSCEERLRRLIIRTQTSQLLNR